MQPPLSGCIGPKLLDLRISGSTTPTAAVHVSRWDPAANIFSFRRGEPADSGTMLRRFLLGLTTGQGAITNKASKLVWLRK